MISILHLTDHEFVKYEPCCMFGRLNDWLYGWLVGWSEGPGK